MCFGISGKDEVKNNSIPTGVARLLNIPFFVLILSIHPILYLYSQNIVFIPIEQTYTALVITISSAFIFSISIGLILRNMQEAAILVSLGTVMFFSFGHLTNLLQESTKNLPGFTINYPVLGWSWLGVFLILAFFALRERLPKETTLALNCISLALIVIPAWTIVTTILSSRPDRIIHDEQLLSEIRDEKTALKTQIRVDENITPDIYFILLDGYERPDKLQEYYQLDVSDFITELSEKGFYIADQARANYLNTTYSLNSTLNLVNFEEFPSNLIKVARYNLQTNYVSDFLKERGYQIIVFDSGTGDTNNQYADVYLSPVEEKSETVGVNPYESLLLQTTLLQAFFKQSQAVTDASFQANQINHELDVHRNRIESALTHLADYADDDAPQFLFAHIYSPHIPFLYDSNGEPLEYASTANVLWYESAPEDYIEQYGYQIKQLNRMVLESMDAIFNKSTRPFVVILLSDHGDDYYLDWKNPTTQGVDLRSSILYAVYYSDRSYADFYPEMTAVNTFRNVFNHWFGTSFPLLPDRVSYHAHSVTVHPGVLPKFFDACADFGICVQH